jgi:biopolymer transport protein ExbD
MAIKKRGHLIVEPDLTPMLDLTFNLITFFIMVSNMSQDVYDQRVRLPVAGSAAPLAEAGTDRLVLNIDSDGRLLFNERTLSTEEAVKEIRFQADLARLNAESIGKAIPPGAPLPSTVILRADRDTPFGEVFTIITACQAQGYLKFDLRGVTSAP